MWGWRAGKLQGSLGQGMGKIQLPGVQQQVLQAIMGFKITILLVVPMLSISQNVMPDMSQMPTNLMRSTSKQLYFQQTVPASGIPARGIERLFCLGQNLVSALGFLQFARPLAR